MSVRFQETKKAHGEERVGVPVNLTIKTRRAKSCHAWKQPFSKDDKRPYEQLLSHQLFEKSSSPLKKSPFPRIRVTVNTYVSRRFIYGKGISSLETNTKIPPHHKPIHYSDIFLYCNVSSPPPSPNQPRTWVDPSLSTSIKMSWRLETGDNLRLTQSKFAIVFRVLIEPHSW